MVPKQAATICLALWQKATWKVHNSRNCWRNKLTRSFRQRVHQNRSSLLRHTWNVTPLEVLAGILTEDLVPKATDITNIYPTTHFQTRMWAYQRIVRYHLSAHRRAFFFFQMNQSRVPSVLSTERAARCTPSEPSHISVRFLCLHSSRQHQRQERKEMKSARASHNIVHH